MFSLDIHVNAIQEKAENIGVLKWNNAELGEKPAVFSNGEKRRESGQKGVPNAPFSLLRRGIPSNGESSQVP